MALQKTVVVAGIYVAMLPIYSLTFGQTRESSKQTLCTFEEVGLFTPYFNCSLDLVKLARSLLTSDTSYKSGQFDLNRTIVHPSDVFELVASDNALNPTCTGFFIIAGCPVAFVLSEWLSSLEKWHVVYNLYLFPCHITSRFIVNLATSESEFIDLVQKIVEVELKWKRVLLIHNTLFSPIGASILRLALSKAFVTQKLVQIEELQRQANGELDLDFLENMFHVILHLEPQALNQFIDQAASSSLLGQGHQWVIITDSTCEQALGRDVLRNSNTVVFKPTHIAHAAEFAACPGKRLDQDIHPDQSKVHLLAAGFRFLLRVSSNLPQDQTIQGQDGPQLKDLMTLTTTDGQVTFDLNSGLLASWTLEYCSSDSKSDQGYSYVGTWTDDKNVSSTASPLFKNIFTHFDNETLLVATLPATPFVIKSTNAGQQSPTYTGFCVDLLNELAKRLHFRYQIVEPSDRLFGSLNSDNVTWNGMVDMVLKKEVALAIGSISITSDRKTVVDFTTSYGEEGVGILTRRPGFDSEEMFRLLTPFKTSLWLSLIATVFGAATGLYLVNRTSPYSSPGSSRSVQNQLTLFTCFWAMLASSMDQGTDIHPNSQSARLLLGFWWFFIIILVSTYTANLAAVLTVTIYEKSINSLSELVEQSEIKPIIKPGTNLETLFRTANNDVYKSIAQKLVIPPTVTSNEDAMVWVKNKNMAFITDRSQLEYIMLKECETYTLADEIFNSGGLGFIVSKDAPFLDAFNLIIIKLRQSGILEGWRSRWWASEGSQCSAGYKVSKGRELGLLYLAGPFFLFLAALAFSVILALGEWAWRTGKFHAVWARLLRWKLAKFKWSVHNQN